MAGEIFAAIDVGSYELSMKVFEISSKKGVRELDYIRHRIDLGTETYATGRISTEHVHEITRVLMDYDNIMQTYGVTHYQAYGTSAMRETHNIRVVLEQLEQRTGIHIDVLSNSEQRFLDYKSTALRSGEFSEIIVKPTAIVDIGGGSIQISLFDNDKLVTTQNMKLGVLRLHQTLDMLGSGTRKYKEMITELVESQLSVFEKLYLKDRKFKNLIIIDDYLSPVIQNVTFGECPKGFVDACGFENFISNTGEKSKQALAKELNIPDENISLLYISGLLVRNIAKVMGTELLWAPGMTLCDGIAYEYAERKKMIRTTHDFEQDIIACAQNISKRYMGSRMRAETLQAIALPIFDHMKKIHGLGKRERLLLQIATILHDCGKYISLVNLGECSYNIIMSTEIIGLSHKEREIVANVVLFNHEPFAYYNDHSERYSKIDQKAYLTIAKLTAILRVANGLDRTHRQKFKDVHVMLKENELVINVDTMNDITVEQGLFNNRAGFFEEIFGVRPIIRQKRTL
ncbi:MAG: HD domain-containing protein [Butyrivibrio sp.]|nr:HD domain-containing protein [Butyrivibrio sp.]